MARKVKRFEVSQDLAEAIRSETYLIHRYLKSGELVLGLGVDDRIEELNWRFSYLQAHGLYYPAPEKQGAVVWSDLRFAQAEIARIHALGYQNKGGYGSGFYLVEGKGMDDVPFESRSENHLTQIFNGKDTRGLSRLDLALLAHVYQTPIPVLETADRALFQQYVQALISHKALFRTGPEFLEVSRSTTPSLVVVHDYEIDAFLPDLNASRHRGFEIVEAPGLPSVLETETPVVVHALLRQKLGAHVDALLLGRVQDKWQLLSTPVLMGETLGLDADLLIPPPRVRDIGGAKLITSEPGDFEVVLIASSNALDGFPAWVRTKMALERERTSAARVNEEDFQWLRELILTRGWQKVIVLRRLLEVQKRGKTEG